MSNYKSKWKHAFDGCCLQIVLSCILLFFQDSDNVFPWNNFTKFVNNWLFVFLIVFVIFKWKMVVTTLLRKGRRSSIARGEVISPQGLMAGMPTFPTLFQSDSASETSGGFLLTHKATISANFGWLQAIPYWLAMSPLHLDLFLGSW